ncbi:MAG: hypothetical protein ACK50A_08510 [Sphingobacteriaceae bacterium]|jgi:hypothetical protein
MESHKLNKMWIGLLVGISFPLFCYSIYWLFFQRNVDIPEDDIRYLINKELMLNVFKICCGTDLLFFYLSLNRKMVAFAKGIIASVLIYALILAYLTFF